MHLSYTRTVLRGLAVVALLAFTAGPLFGAEKDPELDARLAKADAGPRTIDVSSYPKAAQERYEVFAQTCKKCHTLARPINSSYALPSEWSRYVKRMMHKPGSGITPTKGKQIYEFLTYDASVRRSALVEQKLEQLPVDERAKEEKKIDDIRARLEGGGA